jgi:hypothetical protein
MISWEVSLAGSPASHDDMGAFLEPVERLLGIMCRSAILMKDPTEWSLLAIQCLNETSTIKIVNIAIGINTPFDQQKV